MKRLTAALFAILFASTFAFAQEKGGDPKERIDKMNEKMRSELSLTDTQYEQVKPINESFVYEMMELRGPDNREAMKEAKDRYMAQLEEILTEDQMTKYKEMVRNKRKQRRGNKKIF